MDIGWSPFNLTSLSSWLELSVWNAMIREAYSFNSIKPSTLRIISTEKKIVEVENTTYLRLNMIFMTNEGKM